MGWTAVIANSQCPFANNDGWSVFGSLGHLIWTLEYSGALLLLCAIVINGLLRPSSPRSRDVRPRGCQTGSLNEISLHFPLPLDWYLAIASHQPRPSTKLCQLFRCGLGNMNHTACSVALHTRCCVDGVSE